MPRDIVGYGYVGATVVLTVYGQLVFKWRMDDAGDFPGAGGARAEYFWRVALDPWVISVFVASALAAVTWAASLKYFDLSHAYPFMSLSFVAVLLLSGLFFSEPVTAAKLAGIVLIVVGLAVGSQN